MIDRSESELMTELMGGQRFLFERLWRKARYFSTAREYVWWCGAVGSLVGLLIAVLVCALTHTRLVLPTFLMFGYFLAVVYGLRSGTIVWRTRPCQVSVFNNRIVVWDVGENDVFSADIAHIIQVFYQERDEVLTIRGTFSSKKHGRRHVRNFVCRREEIDRFLDAVLGMDGASERFDYKNTMEEK